MSKSWFDDLIDDILPLPEAIAMADKAAADRKASSLSSPERIDDKADAEGDEDVSTAPGAVYRENCRKCNGRGRFHGYSGRDFGQCFACKGVGYFERKTSPVERAQRRAGAAKRKANDKAERCEAFAAAYPAEWAWLQARAGRNINFNFPGEMVAKIEQWGELTERQLEAVQRLVAKDAERDAARAQKTASAPVVAQDKLMDAFNAALASGLRNKLKLRFKGFTASLASASGKNPGAVYLKAGETYLGKIANGRFHASRDATEEQQAAILAAMVDPLSAAVAYGRETGVCSCCGAELTNKLSIELGIGPICRSKWGLG